ncbi:MAG: phytanoyl-CoA dioxygenase family protein [Deltaproteobacteria bacterium]|jgi:predicted dehydrogenase|nr:phytanoyl-CoA dioxygenase family protein [Deltaproteobacteria bacterium]
MGKSLGWGIIGAGDVVDRKSAAAFREVPGTHLAAVMRRSADRVEDFARRHDVPFWTTDAEELIGHSEVDAIYVATPPNRHVEYALAACAAGKPCLVEKPAGRSAQECRRMVEAFDAVGLPFFVSYYRRHLPKFQKVKEILDSGQIGTIVSISYRLAKRPDMKNWRLAPSIGGAGRFYDLSGHVLDLLDFFFGPLELTGSAAANAIPIHDAEDAVALSFRTPGGAVGTASWNFAATRSVDELLIEGVDGGLRLQGMSTTSPVVLEIDAAAALLQSTTYVQRNLRKIQKKLKLSFDERHRFSDVTPHRPMLEWIVEEIGQGGKGSGAAALRSSEVMNGALETYYGGRNDAFWERPQTWNSIRAQRARSGTSEIPERYRLSDEQISFYQKNGYLGPFECDGDWQHLRVPVRKGQNLHRIELAVFEICTHPSIAQRVAQVMGTDQISLFKSRFVVKDPHSARDVAWHQDAGATNGGFFPDGSAFPTVSVWMALDEVTAANGAMQVIAGSHNELVGDYKKRIRAGLIEKGDLTQEELDKAITFELKPGQFYIFHSWLLHGSDPNDSDLRRAGLNIRFARVGDEYDEGVEYFPLSPAEETRG